LVTYCRPPSAVVAISQTGGELMLNLAGLGSIAPICHDALIRCQDDLTSARFYPTKQCKTPPSTASKGGFLQI
jgi:hypothetical protein